MQAKLAEGSANKEVQLLYGSFSRYGIYQLKNNPELRDFHFTGTAELLKRGILSDDFKEIQPGALVNKNWIRIFDFFTALASFQTVNI